MGQLEEEIEGGFDVEVHVFEGVGYGKCFPIEFGHVNVALMFYELGKGVGGGEHAVGAPMNAVGGIQGIGGGGFDGAKPCVQIEGEDAALFGLGDEIVHVGDGFGLGMVSVGDVFGIVTCFAGLEDEY